MVTHMTAYSAAVRATHVLNNAAGFGGSLMGAVALNPVAEEGDNRRRALLHPTTSADVVAKTALAAQRRQAGLLDRASNRPGR
jgi:predicted anti-sigma-YlaC factor YlaD